MLGYETQKAAQGQSWEVVPLSLGPLPVGPVQQFVHMLLQQGGQASVLCPTLLAPTEN